MKKNRAYILFLPAFALISLALALSGCSEGIAAGEAARVNGKPILRSLLDEYVNQLAAEEKQADQPTGDKLLELQGQALEELVLEELLLEQAEKLDMGADEGEIESKLAQIKQQSFDNDEEKFNEALASQGFTIDEVKERIANGIKLDKLYMQIVGDATTIGDSDIETYYEANKDTFYSPEKRKLRHILLGSEAEAQSVKARLDRGEDFGALAAERSLDDNSKNEGGDLGWIEQGVANESFDKAAFSLGLGQVSAPVQTASGWNIVKVDEIKTGGIPPLEEVREEINQSLMRERGETAWTDWLTEIRQSAKIEYAADFKSLQARGAMPAGHP